MGLLCMIYEISFVIVYPAEARISYEFIVFFKDNANIYKSLADQTKPDQPTKSRI
jgi:hypothetical protein